MEEIYKAWADHIGVDYDDERVKHGWPEDFRNFRAGWEAARMAAVYAWDLVPDGTTGEHVPFIKRVVFGLRREG